MLNSFKAHSDSLFGAVVLRYQTPLTMFGNEIPQFFILLSSLARLLNMALRTLLQQGSENQQLLILSICDILIIGSTRKIRIIIEL